MYTIHFWHGKNEELLSKIKSIQGVTQLQNGIVVYNGSLDYFVEQYQDRIMVIPKDKLIAITHNNHFGQM